MHWQETYDAPIFSKQINGYHASSDGVGERVCSQVNQEDAHVNRPNVTACGVPEGLIIQNGKPFTFNGYADAFDHPMKTAEFSMVGGEMWMSFDVGEADPALAEDDASGDQQQARMIRVTRRNTRMLVGVVGAALLLTGSGLALNA